MSPRRTDTFHQLSNGEHFGTVGFISLEFRDLFGQRLLVVEAKRSLDQRRPNGLGTRQARGLETSQSRLSLSVESEGDCMAHHPIVSQSVIHS